MSASLSAHAIRSESIGPDCSTERLQCRLALLRPDDGVYIKGNIDLSTGVGMGPRIGAGKGPLLIVLAQRVSHTCQLFRWRQQLRERTLVPSSFNPVAITPGPEAASAPPVTVTPTLKGLLNGRLRRLAATKGTRTDRRRLLAT